LEEKLAKEVEKNEVVALKVHYERRCKALSDSLTYLKKHNRLLISNSVKNFIAKDIDSYNNANDRIEESVIHSARLKIKSKKLKI